MQPWRLKWRGGPAWSIPTLGSSEIDMPLTEFGATVNRYAASRPFFERLVRTIWMPNLRPESIFVSYPVNGRHGHFSTAVIVC